MRSRNTLGNLAAAKQRKGEKEMSYDGRATPPASADWMTQVHMGMGKVELSDGPSIVLLVDGTVRAELSLLGKL